MKVAAGVALVLLAPLLLVLAPLGGHSEQACAPSVWIDRADRDHSAIGDLDDGQMHNAAVIVGEAIDRGLGRRGAVIGVMTALTESSLRILDHGDAAGPDSRGMFQQRSSWGPLAVRMRPTGSSELFFSALEAVPGWRSMPPWMAAQSVQRSAFSDGSNYRSRYSTAVTAVNRLLTTAPGKKKARPSERERLRAVGMSTGACGGGGLTSVSAKVPIPSAPSLYRGTASGCVVPDPTGTGGCITHATAHLLRQTDARFSGWPWGVACWDEHAWSPKSDHPLGRACDFTVGQLGSFPTEAQARVGWSLAEWLRVYAQQLHIEYIIWDGQIWSQSRGDEGWRRYDGGGIYDVGSPSGGHHDHVHASLEI